MHTASKLLKRLTLSLVWLPFASPSWAQTANVGSPAPLFRLAQHDGGEFNLANRRGNGWTVLYFYPKAGTPGCTTQACAFRDAIDAIRQKNAEVYGISTDAVADLQRFHREHRLNFPLLSDPDAQVTDAYGVKMPVLTMAKRRTFLLDPDLVIRLVEDDVDPALDAQRIADALTKLQGASAR